MEEMTGRICIVTGSNSGIGKQTALALAKIGISIVMVVRNKTRGEKALTEIVSQTGNKAIDLMICDLSSMDSIRRFAEEFQKTYTRLDVLINNAGAVFDKRQVTSEGFERTLAVNYLAPFLLTYELLDLLKASAPSRIINMTSGLAKKGNIDLDNLQSEEKNYSGMKAYSNAKLMLIVYTYELAKRLEGTRVTANVVMPGFVATNLGKNTGSLRSSIMFKIVRPMQISAKKGAETSVYLASSEDIKAVSGKCFSKKKIAITCPESYEEELQKLLWNKTQRMLGLAT
jgi:NAD(P)-dependent dehydrogenase (short-subunit alcohol dehydrogenase family)